MVGGIPYRWLTSQDKHGLAININMDDNTLDFDLARSVGDFFRLSLSQMDATIKEVMKSVNQWPKVAGKIGISKREQEMLKEVF